MNTKRQYKKYTNEFKTEALPLVNEQNYTVQEAISALDILCSWKQKAEEHQNSTVNPNE